MHLSYFEKLTLLDYPEKLASVVFTPGCVFRCPYCHSPELSAPPSGAEWTRKSREEEFFSFLETRKGKLDGVCVTGGEPTLQWGLGKFAARVKKMGFLVKIDTNGLFPDRVEKLLQEGSVDYFAMDIKHTPEKYHIAAGKKIPVEDIKRSAALIAERARDYELRTTVVPGMHTEEDIMKIAEWIRGARAYYLQEFRDIKLLDPSLAERARGKSLDLDAVAKKLAPYFEKVAVRR